MCDFSAGNCGFARMFTGFLHVIILEILPTRSKVEWCVAEDISMATKPRQQVWYSSKRRGSVVEKRRDRAQCLGLF